MSSQQQSGIDGTRFPTAPSASALHQSIEKCEEIVFEIEELARSAKTFKTTCLRLARVARRVCNTILLHCKFNEDLDVQPEAIYPVRSVLSTGKEIVSKCSRHYAVVVFFRVKEIKAEFEKWPGMVLEALASFGKYGEMKDQTMKEEFEMEILSLKTQITSLSFVDVDMVRFCSVLESLEASLTELTQLPAFTTLSTQVEEFMTTNNCSVLDLVDIQETYALNPGWFKGSSVHQDQLIVLQLIIARILRQKEEKNGCNYEVVPDLPSCFKCPISMDLMADPVVVAETGQIYDRRTIARWFETGKSTCPATGKRILSTQLIPLHSLKTDIMEFAQKHNISLEKAEDSEKKIPEDAAAQLSFEFRVRSNAQPQFTFDQTSSTPATLFPPLDRSIFATPINSPFPPSGSAPESEQVLLVNILGEQALTCWSVEHLRYNDYCQRGFSGLSLSSLPEEMRANPQTGSFKNFSEGIQPTRKTRQEFDDGPHTHRPPLFPPLTFGVQGPSTFVFSSGGESSSNVLRPSSSPLPENSSSFAANISSNLDTPSRGSRRKVIRHRERTPPTDDQQHEDNVSSHSTHEPPEQSPTPETEQ